MHRHFSSHCTNTTRTTLALLFERGRTKQDTISWTDLEFNIWILVFELRRWYHILSRHERIVRNAPDEKSFIVAIK